MSALVEGTLLTVIAPLRFKDSPFFQMEEALAETLSLAGEPKLSKTTTNEPR